MRTRLIAAGLVALSIVYLALFVSRGWIPHDEGMIGQSAERVLNGETPHVDYEEPYTGGLAWMHALVFRLAGIDLIYPRWLLFAGRRAGAGARLYLILSRYLQPIAAAMGAWLALGWSFPNYFAALPSWWLLVCALVCVWAFLQICGDRAACDMRPSAGLAAVSVHTRSSRRGCMSSSRSSWRCFTAAGNEPGSGERWWPGRIICAAVAGGRLGLALHDPGGSSRAVRFCILFLPFSRAAAFFSPMRRRSTRGSPGRRCAPAVLAVAAAAAPLLWFVVAVCRSISRSGALVNGVFVLPQKRVQFAALEMPPAQWMLAGLPLLVR